MKLRNKKTGEILEQAVIKSYACGAGYRLMVCNSLYSDIGQHYDTLAELNEDWEDYEPKEPLIKDEKIRKAVRAWAEANELKPSAAVDYSCACYKFEGSYCSIDFNIPVGALESDIYTIAELCGEEE